MAQAQSVNNVQIGTIIAETYEIQRLLGRGGMGTVWEATHARLPGKRVAIKVLHPEVAKDQESLARFRREAEIASRIGHPNIVDVHDFNELADGTPYLILELLEGISLEDRIDSGPMHIDEVISLVRQIGSGLRAAHAEGVIHRDLKPQNIFLAKTTDASGNETRRARILDFGISKIRGSSTVQTQDSTILGTPQYMAPEQATGNHAAVDQRTDVFALGAMVYEMIAGRPAFTGQTIPEVVFKVVYEEPTPLDQVSGAPPGMVRAVHCALSKKQEDRFQTVETFVEALSGTALSVANAPVPSVIGHSVPGDQTDPLASTIASGNHPAVTGVHSDGASASNIGMAQTIDSGRMDSELIGMATGRGPLAQSASVPVVHHEHTAPRSPAGVKVAVALALCVGLAGAGVATWAVTREPATALSETPTEPDPAPAATLDAATAGADAAIAPTVIAGGAAGDGAGTASDRKSAGKDGKGSKGRDGKGRDGKGNDGKDSDGKGNDGKGTGGKDSGTSLVNSHDVDVAEEGADVATTVKRTEFSGPDDPRKDLRDAKRLVRSDPTKALFLVRRALGNGGKGAQFYVVQAKAHCVQRDITKVRATLNKLRPGARASVARFCASVGFDLD